MRLVPFSPNSGAFETNPSTAPDDDARSQQMPSLLAGEAGRTGD
jgi:hypothetical protein